MKISTPIARNQTVDPMGEIHAKAVPKPSRKGIRPTTVFLQYAALRTYSLREQCGARVCGVSLTDVRLPMLTLEPVVDGATGNQNDLLNLPGSLTSERLSHRNKEQLKMMRLRKDERDSNENTASSRYQILARQSADGQGSDRPLGLGENRRLGSRAGSAQTNSRNVARPPAPVSTEADSRTYSLRER